MESSSQPPESFQLPLSWVGYDETSIVYANQFLLQFQAEGSFVLGIGQATAPAIVGTPKEVAEQLEDVAFVPVRTLLRVAVSPQKLRELIAVLEVNLGNWERIQERDDPRHHS